MSATRAATPTAEESERSRIWREGRPRRQVFYFACEVADAYVAFVGASPDRRRDIEWVCRTVGLALSDAGVPGRWHLLDGAEVGRSLANTYSEQRLVFARIYAPLMRWLGEGGYLDRGRVIQILCATVVEMQDHAVTRELIEAELRQLRARLVRELRVPVPLAA